jgi:hypothetical protein
VLDYDKEADAYDVTRGGEPRAAAAADAALGVIPAHTRGLLDVGCGNDPIDHPGLPALDGERLLPAGSGR